MKPLPSLCGKLAKKTSFQRKQTICSRTQSLYIDPRARALGKCLFFLTLSLHDD